jgi:Rrf2 family protein
MLFTRASEYALLSLHLLATSTTPQDSETLARKLGISKSFLAKILQNLSKANILKSYKGANGGFMLERAFNEITISDVIHAAEGKKPTVFECSSSEKDCPSEISKKCSVWPFLNSLQQHIDSFLDTMTLDEIQSPKR